MNKLINHTYLKLTENSVQKYQNSKSNDVYNDVIYDVNDGTDDTELKNLSEELQVILSCSNIVPKTVVHQEQNFWVLENYVQASKQFKCHESITLTTQGDLTFLDNMEVLLEKWQGPISVALYAPGDDFRRTLESIAYLRNCQSDLVKELVTFHIFFDVLHMPMLDDIIILEAYIDYHDCSTIPYQINHDKLYKQKNNLTYPINIARNIARRTATTHFVFPTDIELYPSPNFIKKFLQMIANAPSLADSVPPKVFVLPLFELIENGVVPESKTQLQEMITGNMSFVFHAHLCLKCHKIPKYKEWIAKTESDALNVFTSTKRLGYHSEWEPFFIGTNAEPWFDERLTWEGQSNKMTQGLIMCLVDYDYMVLDNAFLIHKPGIKTKKAQMQNYIGLVATTLKLLRGQVKDELISIYGYREGCQWIKPIKKSTPKTKKK